jgi:hypothetical protein
MHLTNYASILSFLALFSKALMIWTNGELGMLSLNPLNPTCER